MRIGRLTLVGVARGAFAALALMLAASGAALAQEKGIGTPPPKEEAARMIATAQAKLAAGEDSFKRGDFDHARTAFDTAMNLFLESGYDIRADAELQAAYRDTVERVHRYQTIGVGAEGDTVWPEQAYEATKDDFRPEDVPLPDLVAAAAADFANATFLVRVAELQRRFREKFKRDFTLTGRDTGVHARLYGFGRAADVRVRDLSPAQVTFIVSHARALNMRVLDFSTSERVYAHNARVISLGRPTDTLSTGIHLHLNDLPRRATNYSAQPAAKQRMGRGRSK